MFLARYLAGFLGLDPGGDRGFRSGAVVYREGQLVGGASAYKVPTVWRAVNVLAAAVATLPINVFRRLEPRGKEVAKDVALHRLLRLSPNAMQTSFTWRQQLMGHAVLGGNYYAQKVKRDREIVQIFPLDPDRMQIVNLRGDGTLEYLYTLRNGEPKHMTQDDVLHVRGFTHDGVRGISVLELMNQLVNQALTSQRHQTNFLRNELRPSATVSHPGELKPAGRESLEGSLQKAFGGPTQSGRLVVLDEGMELKPYSISARDAQFIQGEVFRVEEFLRFIGVPGVLVGHADKTAAYASAEAFFRSFKDHNLFPWTRNIEQELTVSLFGREQDELFVEFNLDAFLRPDSEARANFYRTLVELGILTRNEVRELENRNALEGLDEPLTPLNMGREVPSAAVVEALVTALRPTGLLQAGQGREVEQLRAIAHETTAALVRKEVRRFTGEGMRQAPAARFAKDPEGWQRYVAEFYREHSRLIATRLRVPEALARRYCDEQKSALLEGGLKVCETWERDRAPALLALIQAD